MHRLVAEAFLQNPNEYKSVNHLDEDKTNNRVDNLVWCTQQKNVSYSRSKPVELFHPEGFSMGIFESRNYIRRTLGIRFDNACTHGYTFRFLYGTERAAYFASRW